MLKGGAVRLAGALSTPPRSTTPLPRRPSLHSAAEHIRRGEADLMLAGGSEAVVIPSAIGGFIACKALSKRNEDPTAASRPWDRDRDGFVMGEGAGELGCAACGVGMRGRRLRSTVMCSCSGVWRAGLTAHHQLDCEQRWMPAQPGLGQLRRSSVARDTTSGSLRDHPACALP